MKAFALAGPALLVLGCLLCSACATTTMDDSGEAVGVEEQAAADEEPEAADEAVEEELAAESKEDEESEVPLAVAESEQPIPSGPDAELAEVVVMPARHDVIHNHVAEAQALLRGVDLKYFFTGKGKKEVLRGRPVAFALWSEAKMEWIIANVEIPRPPIKWKPGRKPLPFTLLTPGITATHVKGTGAERLMFAFSRNGEPLKVYGRKFPVFDDKLIKKKQWRAVAENARAIVYLPFTEDTFDPLFVSGGKDYLLATARRALSDLRLAGAPSKAFPGKSLADVVPAEVITTLAVIEQTDDRDFVDKGEIAFNEVLSQYGLKRGEAYRYSVSSASAIGPMQFTNRRGNGTYALVVRRCPEARARPQLRARRHRPAQCHEGRHLPVRHRAQPDGERDQRCLPGQHARAGHLPRGCLQRRTEEREEAGQGHQEDERAAGRAASARRGARRQARGLPLPVEGDGGRDRPRAHSPLQQREPLVHREVPADPGCV